jgi:hypothetical protein
MSKLLLVEDNIMLLETTKELLEAQDYQVYTAASGLEARKAMAAHGAEIDLVLLDLSLPDVDGEALLGELAASFSNLKVVLCTGTLPDENLRRHPAVRGYLGKPFDLRELRETITKALAS